MCVSEWVNHFNFNVYLLILSVLLVTLSLSLLIALSMSCRRDNFTIVNDRYTGIGIRKVVVEG